MDTDINKFNIHDTSTKSDLNLSARACHRQQGGAACGASRETAQSEQLLFRLQIGQTEQQFVRSKLCGHQSSYARESARWSGAVEATATRALTCRPPHIGTGRTR